MSHSKQTANYGLPLFEPKDRPAWLTDFNGAMTAVDATVKGLEDSIQAGGLPITGGTMQGSINMGNHAITNVGSPTADKDAATKEYVDTAIGNIPTSGITQEQADARYLQLSGGTMTGDLKVQEIPANAESAISKSYAQGLFASAMPKSGGTMTGPLILSGAPTADLSAATKKYVDDQITLNITDVINASY